MIANSSHNVHYWQKMVLFESRSFETKGFFKSVIFRSSFILSITSHDDSMKVLKVLLFPCMSVVVQLHQYNLSMEMTNLNQSAKAGNNLLINVLLVAFIISGPKC